MIRRQRSRLETLLSPAADKAGRHRGRANGSRLSDRTMPAAMSDEDTGQRAGAVSRLRTAREAGAAREAEPARPRRVAGRAARDEDHDGADARPVQRRALTAFRATAALCFQRQQPLSASAARCDRTRRARRTRRRSFSIRDTPRRPAGSTADSIPSHHAAEITPSTRRSSSWPSCPSMLRADVKLLCVSTSRPIARACPPPSRPPTPSAVRAGGGAHPLGLASVTTRAVRL